MALASAGTKVAALLQFNSVPDRGEQLKALGHDYHPNVGNLIGYSYRKPGGYKFSQVWRGTRPVGRTMERDTGWLSKSGTTPDRCYKPNSRSR